MLSKKIQLSLKEANIWKTCLKGWWNYKVNIWPKFKLIPGALGESSYVSHSIAKIIKLICSNFWKKKNKLKVFFEDLISGKIGTKLVWLLTWHVLFFFLIKSNNG